METQNGALLQTDSDNPPLNPEHKRDPTLTLTNSEELLENKEPSETPVTSLLLQNQTSDPEHNTVTQAPVVAPNIEIREGVEQASNAGAESSNKRFVIQLRGLGWNSTVEDVFDFLDGSSAIKTVHIVAGRSGRTCGEAMVEFSTEEAYKASFKHNGKVLHKRMIEVRPGSASELDRSLGRTPRAKVPTNPMSYVIRMRGVPYSATVEDIEHFFGNLKPDAIHIPRDEFGRPSGDAFVEFARQEDGYLATYRHRDCIGNRYIEIFQSTIKELCSTMGVQMKSRSKKLWIKMQGLPYGTKLRQVLEFFASVKVFPIRLARRSDGSQVFAEFQTAQEVNDMMKLQQRYIGHRYVEFFPCDLLEVEKATGKDFGPALIHASPGEKASMAIQQQPATPPHFFHQRGPPGT